MYFLPPNDSVIDTFCVNPFKRQLLTAEIQTRSYEFVSWNIVLCLYL
jgi:hypothetical protein